MIPEFKDKIINKLIISPYGDCYSIKKEYESNVKYPHQKVVFATLVSGELLNKLKDLNPNLLFKTTTGGEVKIKEDCVITTTADFYNTEEDFFKYYIESAESIDSFIREYQESRKNKNQNKAGNKNISRPMKRK